MSYKVLVADDEYIIRRGIIKLLRRYAELEVVAEAEDGEQALEFVQEFEPDILFVDINMPFINGLQFIEKLKGIRPDAVVSIITGYDKFEYVRQALRLGVFEYILKPLNENAFDDTIHRILELLQKRSREEQYLTWAKGTLNKNKSGLLGEFFDKCRNRNYSEDEIREEFAYLDLNLPEEYTMTLICLDRLETADLKAPWSESLLWCSAWNIVSEIYERLSPLWIFKSSQGYLVLLCKSEAGNVMEELNRDYKAAVEKYIPVKINLLQKTGSGLTGFPCLYRELLDGMDEIKSCPAIIKKLQKFVLSSYCREDFSLTQAAEYVGMSPQHVSRIFRREMGITFIDYLTQVRLQRAIELFEDENIKMYEIAERVGYATQHYFSSVFRKALGVSPLEYKHQHQNRKKGYACTIKQAGYKA